MPRPAESPGRLLERIGDDAPRGMTVHDRTRLTGRLRHLKSKCPKHGDRMIASPASGLLAAASSRSRSKSPIRLFQGSSSRVKGKAEPVRCRGADADGTGTNVLRCQPSAGTSPLISPCAIRTRAANCAADVKATACLLQTRWAPQAPSPEPQAPNPEARIPTPESRIPNPE